MTTLKWGTPAMAKALRARWMDECQGAMPLLVEGGAACPACGERFVLTATGGAHPGSPVLDLGPVEATR